MSIEFIVIIGETITSSRAIALEYRIGFDYVATTPEALVGYRDVRVFLLPGHKKNKHWKHLREVLRGILADGRSEVLTIEQRTRCICPKPPPESGDVVGEKYTVCSECLHHGGMKICTCDNFPDVECQVHLPEHRHDQGHKKD